MGGQAVSIDHVSIQAGDYQRSMAFYTKTLAPLGISHIDMPYTAPKLWEAIRHAEAHA